MKIDYLTKFFGLKKSNQPNDEKPNLLGIFSEFGINNKEFVVNCKDMSIALKLIKGYVFSLYTRDDLNDVKIFTNDTIGGDGFVGFVPHKYKEVIRNHLINTKSNFGNKTIIASLISKDNNQLKIGFELISQEKIRELEACQLNQFIDSRRVELNKTYRMKSSV